MRKMSIRYIWAISVMIAAVSLPSCTAKQQTVETKGYKTPEQAVESYLDGLKNNDLEHMMDSFAIDIYVDNYDYEGQIDRNKIYTYSMEIKLPNTTSLSRDLNVESRRANISSSILMQYVSMARPGFDLVEVRSFKEEGSPAEFADQFAEKLGALKTDTIKLLGFIPPEELSEFYTLENNQKNMAKLAAIYGANKIESRAAVFEIDGKEHIMCMDVADYGGRWYILGLGGNIGQLFGLNLMSGGVFPIAGLESELDIDWKELMVPVP